MTPEQVDRAEGALLGAAVGDALGVPYEFGSAEVGRDGPEMLGGGLGDFAPGEWSDDTAMLWCIADVAATGADLRSESALDQVARNFRQWFDTSPADIGIQTRRVLAEGGPEPTAAALAATSHDLHRQTGRTAGNGSLMRTAPVALAHLDDPVALVEAAQRVSRLTHYDPLAGDACALWCLAIRHAVLDGEFELRTGLELLAGDASVRWADIIEEAEQSEPGSFTDNGYVVVALQAAWSSIVRTDASAPDQHVADTLSRTIGIGVDTDTVAAITGALLGARWGAAAVPARWRDAVHGYPGITGADLAALARTTVEGRA
ncbi:ADP-ribosylglycohydrolase family protein [Nocardioides sp. MH1]|uniref:ADP-ribosylglycohydrolase family protein n=1 Tax=Nocardioides sp. MH1 TaxID=3242490 RepID=UPI0035229273